MSSDWTPKELAVFSQERDRLVGEIRRAFANVSREGGESISEARALDHHQSLEQSSLERAFDTDTHWSEIDILEKDPHTGPIYFMGPISFRYHLPAYMIFELSQFFPEIGDIDFDTNHNTPWILAHYGQHDRSRLSLFSLDQLRATARFFVFSVDFEGESLVSSDSDYAGAFCEFWGQYLPNDERLELIQRYPILARK